MSTMQTVQGSPKTPERSQQAEDNQVYHHAKKHRRINQGSPITTESLQQTKAKRARHRPNQSQRDKVRENLQEELDSLLATIPSLDDQICEAEETLEELDAEEKRKNQHLIGLQREISHLFYKILFGTELILHTGAYTGASQMKKVFHQLCESNVTKEIVDLEGEHPIDDDGTD
jgi:hypothetical protein